MTERAPIVPWKMEEPYGYAPYRTQALEIAERELKVYVRWRLRGNWVKRLVHDAEGKPLKLRTADGKLIKARIADAEAAAVTWYNTLVANAGAGAAPEITKPPLTLAEGRRLAFHPKSGHYPTDTQHRREIELALRFAEAVWGAEGITTWEALKKRHLRMLWRARIEQLRKKKAHGHASAAITISRVLTVAAWLRSEEYLPGHVAVFPGTWRAELTADWMEITEAVAEPAPKRPRYTLEEMRRIMAAAPKVDPRFELLMALGAEQRLGQVIRAWRSSIDLAHATFKIPGRGKKKGAVLELTDGQMAVVRRALTTGYLSELERATPDYPLFPGSQLAYGRKGEDPKAIERHITAPPISRQRTLREWFLAAERLAKVPNIRGRGAYGIRRQAVDAAKAEGISVDGLQEHGGWTNSKIPNEIYAEQERVNARREARDVRAKIRGEKT